MNYHNITTNDMNNGDGLRVVLWTAGCSHHCEGCQNPQTWDQNGGILFDDKAFKELIKELEKPYISGLTLSGGDPLFEGNLDTIENIIKMIRKKFGNSKTIWLYSGYSWNKLQQARDIRRINIISMCDVFVDGKYQQEFRDTSLHWVGSSNQNVIKIRRV